MPNGESSLDNTTHLAIGAHADDIEFFAFHGILSCYDNKEKNFSGITMTSGGGSPRAGKYASMNDEEMIRIRLEEQIEAARIGKYHAQIQLGHPSSMIKNLKESLATDELIYLLKACKPEVIYTHSLSDRHDTHIAVTLRVIHAVRAAKISLKSFWGCEVWGSLDWLPQRHPLAVSENEDLAIKLCAVHKSQIEGGKRYDLATIGRRRANATFYESHQTDK